MILGTDGLVPETADWRTAEMSWSEETLRSPAGAFLPTAIVGRTFLGPHANGDFLIPAADLTAGRMGSLRRAGPGGTPLPPPPPGLPRLPGHRRWPFGR